MSVHLLCSRLYDRYEYYEIYCIICKIKINCESPCMLSKVKTFVHENSIININEEK